MTRVFPLINKNKSSGDWFRKKTWTKSDQDDFFLHLKRAKDPSKAQYIRIQAVTLQKVDPTASLKLLQELIANYPDSRELAQVYCQLAECYISLGQSKEAIDAFMSSFQAERSLPNFKTQAYLKFGLFIVKNELKDLYPPAIKILNEFGTHLLFPKDKYQFNTIKAIVSYEDGVIDQAKQYAQHALEAAAQTHSGLRYHPTVGVVSQQDGFLEQKLKQILETK